MTNSKEERKITLKEWQDVLAVMNRYSRDYGWVDNENLEKLTFFDSQPSTGGAYVTREDVKKYIAVYSAKKARVVMVPAADGIVISLKDSNNSLPAVQEPPREGTTDSNWKQANHLCFISDDKIGPDEFGIINHPENGLAIMQNHLVQTTEGDMRAYDFWKAEGKVIAITKTALGLPSIPQAWIRDVYVPANGKIEEVLLKTVEESGDFTDSIESRMLHCIDNEVVILG